ncbi:MAG: serine/threonine-protein kinase HipA [Zhongshania aliphaticivorans]|jgi:serine/threonine-protein kinase HipA
MIMKTLNVIYYGERVGELTQADTGRLGFVYDEAWLTSDNPRAISNSLPLQAEAFDERECIGYFGGLLPEENIRDIIAKNLGITSKNDFAMLREIGGECAGAISLLGQDAESDTKKSRYKHLSETDLEAILLRLPQTPLMAGTNEIRLSLAGAQNKLAIFKDANGFAIPLRESPSSHIIKPDSQHFPKLVENEAYCLWLATQCGLPCAEAEVIDIGEQRCLFIKRYDRYIQDDNLIRLHQEDFCQALGISSRLKYQNEGGPSFENSFSLLRDASSQPARDLITLFESAIFNYLIGNNDAHGKNFSLLYSPISERFSARLAPLYDLVCTTYFQGLSPKMAMKVGGTYLPSEIRMKHWEILWEAIGFSKKRAAKQSLNFANKVEACLKPTPNDEVEAAIQKIIRHRIKSLRTALRAGNH